MSAQRQEDVETISQSIFFFSLADMSAYLKHMMENHQQCWSHHQDTWELICSTQQLDPRQLYLEGGYLIYLPLQMCLYKTYVEKMILRDSTFEGNVYPAYQLLEGRLLQVALQREVAEAFPRWLVRLHLHRVPLNCVLMPDRTACHHGGSREALQVLREEGKTFITQPTRIYAL